MAAPPAESVKAKRRRIAFVLLSGLLYVAGVASFFFYPTQFARQTYVSENALLVSGATAASSWASVNEFLTKHFRFDDIKHLSNHTPSTTAALFRSLGLETYVQTIARNGSIPLTNVYAYMRALKSAGSEAVVISADSSTYGYPLIVAFASTLRDARWFSKDVILLVADGSASEQAINAWLTSYHELPSADVRDVFVRSGVIQAALHVDLRSPDYSDLLGLLLGESGKLPNLDLFNTLVRSAAHERMHVRLPTLKYLNHIGDRPMLHTLFSMLSQLASGVPNGPHSAYLRYHIPALSVRSGSNTGKPLGVALQRTGRIVEMVLRSVMSLVESFHQSFYYYLLMSEWHYVSIGTYMISLALILAPLLLTLLQLLYLFYFGHPAGLPQAVLLAIAAHGAGVVSYLSAPYLLTGSQLSIYVPRQLDLLELRAVVWLLLSYNIAWLFLQLPKSLPLSPANVNALRIVYLLPLSVFIGVVSLVNFSFSLVAAIIFVPFVTLFASVRNQALNLFLWLVWSIPVLFFAAAQLSSTALPQLISLFLASHISHNALAFPFVTLLILPMHILALRAVIGSHRQLPVR